MIDASVQRQTRHIKQSTLLLLSPRFANDMAFLAGWHVRQRILDACTKVLKSKRDYFKFLGISSVITVSSEGQIVSGSYLLSTPTSPMVLR